jgi:hypothetical protein
MWFASMYTTDEYPWTFNLAWKLLHNNKNALSLFAKNPFPGQPPKYIRGVLYRYRFIKKSESPGLWWSREKINIWMRPMNTNDQELVGVLKSMGWL